jgi:hypothetical protein
MTTAALTEQHRQMQLAIRTRALSDFARIWPLWQTTDQATFPALVRAAQPLVQHYSGLSAAAAVSYYEAFRGAEHITGAATPRIAAATPEDLIQTSLYVTGENAARAALQAGKRHEEVRATALVRTSGALARHVLDGGRNSIIESVRADPRALGWARVTDGNPCYFCLTLASRGAVYKDETTADFQAHDHCGCVAMPVYKGTALPEQTRRFRDIYDQAQREGVESGQLQPDENTPAARLNAVRRHLAAQQ